MIDYRESPSDPPETGTVAPASFAIIPEAARTTFVLPPRRNRPLTRLYGLFLACLAPALPVFFFFVLRFRVGGVFFHGWHVVAGLVSMFSYGIGLALTGNVTITLSPAGLVAQRRIGPFGSQKSIALRDIARLELDVPDLLRRPVLPHNTSLNAELIDGVRVPLAQGYSRDLLVSLAQELSARLPPVAGHADAAPGVAASPVAIVDVSGIPPIARDVLTQPAKSIIRTAEISGLHTFSIKHYGQIQSPADFIVCQVMILFLLALAATGSAMLFIQWHRHQFPLALPLIVSIITALLLVLEVATLHIFFRRCLVVAGPDSLTVSTHGPLRRTEHHWPRADIVRITTEHAATQKSFRVSSTRGVSLSLTSRTGQKLALLSGPELDMRWLATQLRQILSLPNR